jgi:hypothetical protein
METYEGLSYFIWSVKVDLHSETGKVNRSRLDTIHQALRWNFPYQSDIVPNSIQQELRELDECLNQLNLRREFVGYYDL